MPPKNVEDIYPLTPMQRLMLLHEVMQPDPAALANQVRYEIAGRLRVDSFREAWQLLVDRHAALRTAVLWEGLDQPVQVVRGRLEVPFVDVDLSGLGADEQRARAEQLTRQDASRGFDLGRAPLMRCTLARLGDERHLFIWCAHHLVVDRWSHGVVFGELGELYGALSCGRAPALPPAPQFRDYVGWLRERGAGDAARFWRAQLAGFRTPTLLGGGRAAPGHDRRTKVLQLSAESAAGVDARASTLKTTTASILLGAVALEIARKHGSTDVAYGVTVSGRPPELERVEDMVGSFVNNVPARFRIDPGRPASEWLREIQSDQLRRQPFEHVSLADVSGWSDVPSGRPLFDLLLVLNLAESQEEGGSDLELRPVGATLDGGYPLILEVARGASGLRLTLVHPDGFDAAHLLNGVAARIDELSGAGHAATLGDVLTGLRVGEHTGALPPASVPPASVPPASVPAAATTAEEGLLSIWRQVLGQEDIGLDDDFFVLGGTSLQAAQLFLGVERMTGRSLPLSTLIGASSVRALLEALDEPAADRSPLVALRSGGHRPPLIAVPGIGGNVVGLYPLARELGPDQPFYGLQSRGLDGRDPPLATIEAIAEDFVEQIRPLTSAPFHLLGPCWGAAVAFEMCAALGARDTPPASLSLIDPAVLLRTDEPVARDAVGGLLKNRLELYWEEFREGDWRSRTLLLARKARAVASVVRAGGMTPGSQQEVHQRRVKEHNRQAIEGYRPRSLEGRARLFITQRADVTEASDPRLEWQRLIYPEPRVVPISGFDSGDAITSHAEDLAVTLREWLDAPDEGPR